MYRDMKTLITLFFVGTFLLGINQNSRAQETTLASGLGLFVFPSNDQNKETQDADEMACYKWAKTQTGVDPLNPPEVQAAQVDRSADGTAVVGAAGGAAAGAAIGAIAGDAGKGAAIGAVVGGLRGRRAKVVGDEMQQQQNNAAAAAATEEMMNNFKKAFSACLEGKGYTVK
jgi:hypothetical protein